MWLCLNCSSVIKFVLAYTNLCFGWSVTFDNYCSKKIQDLNKIAEREEKQQQTFTHASIYARACVRVLLLLLLLVVVVVVVLVLVVLVYSRLFYDSNGFHPALYTKAVVHYGSFGPPKSFLDHKRAKRVYPNTLQSRLAKTDTWGLSYSGHAAADVLAVAMLPVSVTGVEFWLINRGGTDGCVLFAVEDIMVTCPDLDSRR